MTTATISDMREAERIVAKWAQRAGAVSFDTGLLGDVAEALAASRHAHYESVKSILTLTEIHGDSPCSSDIAEFCRERLADLTNAPPETMP